MKFFLYPILLLLPLSPVLAQDYPIRPAPFTDVHVQSAFWSPRLDTNRKVTIPFAFQKCEETGRIDNFAVAGGLKKGKFRGIAYDDSDVFKVVEGAAYSLAVQPDSLLDAYLDGLIAKIAAAQEPDGYLYAHRTAHQRNPESPLQDRAGPERWRNLQDSHELYNVGHLYEAAVAHYLATGKKNLLDVAVRNADLLTGTFGEGKRYEVPGHEEIEIGLVKLYRVTGKKEYLKLAKFFIDQRGRHQYRKPYRADWATPVDTAYYQDHIPVTQQTEPVGHVVRAGYLYSGMADVATLTGEPAYIAALKRIWSYTVNKKTYLTGGLGAEAGVEGFGPAYTLPNLTAYNETCAAVAAMLWNYRLFLLTGEGQYLDVFERTLYNGFLSGVSLEGNRFFYPNPLASDGAAKFNHGHPTRSPWFNTSCCPTNVARFLPSLPGYVYAAKDDRLYANLFVAGTGKVKLKDQDVTITQQTDYPWNGAVTFTLQPAQARPFYFLVRIPGWAQNRPLPGNLYAYADGQQPVVKLTVNGKTQPYILQNGFAVIRRAWQPGDQVKVDLSMPVRRVAASREVAENRGKLALERGPLVYCVEGVDNGGTISHLRLDNNAAFTTGQKPELLRNLVTITGNTADGQTFTAIPYFAWSHRGPGEMAVWLPLYEE